MAQLNLHNIKGSTLIETLVALVIIALVFGLSVAFFSNKSYSKSLKVYKNSLELRGVVHASSQGETKLTEDFLIEELVFSDSLCFIQKIRLREDSLSRSSVICVKPIKE